MKLTLLVKYTFIALILGVLTFGPVSAQTTPNPPVRRNSPFAPNPKKVVDPKAVTETSVTRTSQINEAKIAQVKVDESVVKNASDRSRSSESKTAVGANDQKTFESRSIAAKTLEIVKKARVINVSPTETYKVGIGDVLFISLQNAPAKDSTYYTVLKDGTIDYPLAGEMVNIQGYTTDQIEDLLREKIKLYENPQVSVRIREHNSHTFTVLGLVERTGEKRMQRDAIPLYVVSAEAIVNSEANQVTITRNGLEPQTFDLKDNKTGEVIIFPGDVVEYVSHQSPNPDVSQYYFIGGEINSGGRKDFIQGMTLTQAIIESGGLKKSNVKKAIVRRKNESGLLIPTEFDLRSIKKGKVPDPVLLAGDTIEIGNK